MTVLKGYEVTEARFIGAQHRAVGDPVKLSERAAKYYMQPHGTGLKVAAPIGSKKLEKPDPNVEKKTPTSEG